MPPTSFKKPSAVIERRFKKSSSTPKPSSKAAETKAHWEKLLSNPKARETLKGIWKIADPKERKKKFDACVKDLLKKG